MSDTTRPHNALLEEGNPREAKIVSWEMRLWPPAPQDAGRGLFCYD
jgi:hypothetical protein